MQGPGPGYMHHQYSGPSYGYNQGYGGPQVKLDSVPFSSEINISFLLTYSNIVTLIFTNLEKKSFK